MPQDEDLSAAIRRGATYQALIGAGLWPVVLAQPVINAFLSASWGASVNALAMLALFVILYLGLGIPTAATVCRWERRALFAVVFAVVLDTALRSGRLASDLSPANAVLLVPALVLAIAVLVDRRDRLSGRTSPLRWPLPPGDWQIMAGNGRLLNHHWPAPTQRGALDIVGTAPGGRSSRALLSKRLSDYAIFGTAVLSPADGVVLAAVDGHPDHPDESVGAAGNHVVVDTGGERLLLAHFARGSVQVKPGDKVTAGQQIGLVGSSGNSTEPHLHIHAIRDGKPLTLVFLHLRGPLRRGARVRWRPPADPAV